MYVNAIEQVLVFDLVSIHTAKPTLMNSLKLPVNLDGPHPCGISIYKGRITKPRASSRNDHDDASITYQGATDANQHTDSIQ